MHSSATAFIQTVSSQDTQDAIKMNIDLTHVRRLLMLVIAAFAIVSCNKQQEEGVVVVEQDPREAISLERMDSCATEKQWERNELIKELSGSWQWQFEYVISSHVDTANDSHEGLILKFNSTNELIISRGTSIDTTYYDVRPVLNGHNIYVKQDSLYFTKGLLYMCEEEMCIQWYGNTSVGFINWYFKED